MTATPGTPVEYNAALAALRILADEGERTRQNLAAANAALDIAESELARARNAVENEVRSLDDSKWIVDTALDLIADLVDILQADVEQLAITAESDPELAALDLEAIGELYEVVTWDLADARGVGGLGLALGAVTDLQSALVELEQAMSAVRAAEESPLLAGVPSHSVSQEQLLFEQSAQAIAETLDAWLTSYEDTLEALGVEAVALVWTAEAIAFRP